jgi:excinuclease ABC subunit B
MQRMMEETARRRERQLEYNAKHGITPKTILKSVEEIMAATSIADVKLKRDERLQRGRSKAVAEQVAKYLTPAQRKDLLEELRTEMFRAAKDLEFERAAELRDEIERLEKQK